MPWIDDVVTHTTIRSVWGNTIRDHTVGIFANVAERNANGPKVIEGALTWSIAEAELAVRRASTPLGWWILDQPLRSYACTLYSGANPIATNTIYAAWRRRDGDTAEGWVVAQTTAGSFGGIEMLFSLPIPVAAAVSGAGAVIGTGEAAAGTNFAAGYLQATSDPARGFLIDARTNQPYKTEGGAFTFKGHFSYQVAAA